MESQVEIIEPNWALAYCKLARHVTAAHALAEAGQHLASRQNIHDAMVVIVQFETVSHHLIPNARNT